jgi:hypothetical protein
MLGGARWARPKAVVFLLAAAASALLATWAAGAASAAGGQIEICMDANAGDGVAGQQFVFALTKGLTLVSRTSSSSAEHARHRFPSPR